MQKPKQYPRDLEFAVRFHKGTTGVPDGAIKEMIELRPALVRIPANPKNGFPGSDARPAEECPKGYVRKTGAELNAITDALWPELKPILDEKEREQERELARQQSDVEVQNRILDGFEWQGQRFSLSANAQANAARYAVLVATTGTQSRPFIAGNGVEISATAFRDFYAALDMALEKALGDGRARKARVTIPGDS